MAHPETEASPFPQTASDKVEALADFLGIEEQEEDTQEKPEEEEETLETEGDESRDDDLLDDEALEDGEPEEPAIDPPVSWGNDAKELFAQLPPELQTKVAEREAQREKAIQKATTEAAEAKRVAYSEAEHAVAETQRQYADGLARYAELLKPQMPDPNLAITDPNLYIQERAIYDAMTAQYQDMMQQSEQSMEQANQIEQAKAMQAQAAEIAKLAEALPEWNDMAARQALLTDLEKVGNELGYSETAMAEANASDILALKKAAEWKAKAAKWDAAQSRKMETVRNARGLPKVAKPGAQQSSTQRNANKAQNSWQRVRQTKSGDDMADFLETQGIKL